MFNDDLGNHNRARQTILTNLPHNQSSRVLSLIHQSQASIDQKNALIWK